MQAQDFTKKNTEPTLRDCQTTAITECQANDSFHNLLNIARIANAVQSPHKWNALNNRFQGSVLLCQCCHLWDGFWMIIDRVGEFPVVVEDEPASLPSLCPVYRVGEVPVRSYKQVAAPVY